MYSLTFCVRFLLPERHQWKPAVQTAAEMLRTPPSATGRPRPLPVCGARFWGRPPSPGGRRPAARADPAQPAVCTMSSYRGMDASLKLGFALCCHSNATRAPIANPPNSAQLGDSLCHAPSYIRVRAVVWAYGRGQTDTQTQTDTRVTTIHFASSTTRVKCN